MDDRTAERPDRVTIKTVAADAGVSVAAVSKVLRNAYGVSEALRRNVMESIDRLGYRPNLAARGMRGRTQMIGVLLVELRNPFLPEVIDGVNRVLARSNYKAMIGVGRSEETLEASLVESMIDYKMDGLILVAPRLAPAILSGFAAQIPVVVIGYHNAAALDFDTVNSDDLRGGELAVESLVARGFRDILMLAEMSEGDAETSVVSPRALGYRRAMIAAGLQPRPIRKLRNDPTKHAVIESILTAPDRPEAIFCWSDLDAVHVLGAAARLGVRVPEDISVIGYDDSAVAAMPLVDLASISQSGADLGARATEALMQRIGGRTGPVHWLQAPRLVARGSLAALCPQAAGSGGGAGG
jgi:LacI family transcriptional regulator